MSSAPLPPPPPIPCRVCNSPAPFLFHKLLAGKFNVAHYRCPSCGQVQTESPYWLPEIYADQDFMRDVGMVARSFWTAHLTLALAEVLKISPDDACLDHGAGTGLFVRHCRDHGLNMHYQDRYAKNIFALGFEADRLAATTPKTLVTAFEVAEHFPNPLDDFQALFAGEPQHLFISTRLYEGQGPEWWYFAESGQHVAIYTEESLRRVATHFGYHFQSDFDIHFFSRQKIPWRLLKSIRRHPEKAALRYRKRHGSKIEGDVGLVDLLLRQQTAGPAKVT
jgi:hypothetical protein